MILLTLLMLFLWLGNTQNYCNPSYTINPSTTCYLNCGTCCASRNNHREFSCCEYTGTGGECLDVQSQPHDRTNGPYAPCGDQKMFYCAYTNADIITCGGLNQSHPLVCTGHGECDNTGTCQCHLGWDQSLCNVQKFVPGIDWVTIVVLLVPILMILICVIIVVATIVGVVLAIKYKQEKEYVESSLEGTKEDVERRDNGDNSVGYSDRNNPQE